MMNRLIAAARSTMCRRTPGWRTPGWRTRRTRLRPAGWAFVAITVLVLLAAWNTGSNLLYLIASGGVGMLAASLFLALTTLGGLQVSRAAPGAVHRGETFPITVRAANTHRRIPASSVRVESAARRGASAGYIARIPAQRTAVVRTENIIERRGVYGLPPLELVSAFPMGLIETRRQFRDSAEVTVYPRVTTIRTLFMNQLASTVGAPRRRPGDGDEYFSLRDYVRGDDIRRIAWRVSARFGRPVIKEFEPSFSRFVVVALDTLDPRDLAGFDERFEDAVDLAASLAVTLLHRQYSVAVATPSDTLGFGDGSGHVIKVLEMLARVAASGRREGDEVANAQAAAKPIGRAALVYVSPDPRRWGRTGGPHGARVADPREMVRA